METIIFGDMTMDVQQIYKQVQASMGEFLPLSGVKEGQIVVLGCSTSEVCGQRIGQASSEEAGQAIVGAMLPLVRERGLYLAVQCCEHLNRALVIEEAAAEKYGLEIVTVVPVVKAGGACGTAAYRSGHQPVVVERLAAHAGIDIGDTEIGMHVMAVQVPVRLTARRVGEAAVTCLKRRPKFIGGARAQYAPPLER